MLKSKGVHVLLSGAALALLTAAVPQSCADLGPDTTVNVGQTLNGTLTLYPDNPTTIPNRYEITIFYDDGTSDFIISGSETVPYSHVYSEPGTYAITLVVYDTQEMEYWEDTFNNPPPATRIVTVVGGPKALLLALKGDLQDLVDDGSLSARYANLLRPLLDRAIARVDAGQNAYAVAQLRTFIQQLQKLIGAGQVNGQAGQPLIDQANQIIALLNGGGAQ